MNKEGNCSLSTIKENIRDYTATITTLSGRPAIFQPVGNRPPEKKRYAATGVLLEVELEKGLTNVVYGAHFDRHLYRTK